jgi:hypothetical protein
LNCVPISFYWRHEAFPATPTGQRGHPRPVARLGSDKEYAIIDGTPIGRIYADRLPSGEKWLWFLHILRATPNQGIADTLEDAKAALADSYRRHSGHMR